MSGSRVAGARSRARDLTVQALYQQQIADHSATELLTQFHDRQEFASVDQEYFDEVLTAICNNLEALTICIDRYADRPVSQLDPVELSILLLGFHELQERSDIPYRVVINEAVNLCKKFGAVDGYKYVNALLDRAAAELRHADSD